MAGLPPLPRGAKPVPTEDQNAQLLDIFEGGDKQDLPPLPKGASVIAPPAGAKLMASPAVPAAAKPIAAEPAISDADSIRKFIADEPGNLYGAILPYRKDEATGEKHFAIPEMLRSPIRGVADLLDSAKTGDSTVTPDMANTMLTVLPLGLGKGGAAKIPHEMPLPGAAVKPPPEIPPGLPMAPGNKLEEIAAGGTKPPPAAAGALPPLPPGATAAAAPAVTAPPSWAKRAAAGVESIFSPTTRSAGARSTEATIREEVGLGSRSTQQAIAQLEQFQPVIRNMADKDRLDFMNYVETRSTGTKLADPTLQPLADSMRDIYKQRMEQIKDLSKHEDVGEIRDYFVHLWKDPKAAEQVFTGVARQGSGRNLKQRVLPTISDGLKAGLQLVTNDPVEATIRYVGNMDRYIAHNAIMDTMRKQKLVKYFTPGKQPAGNVELAGRMAMKNTPKGVMKAYAPPEVAEVYNNFISRGIHDSRNPVWGNMYDAARKYSNGVSTMKLGLNAYHAFTVTMASIASEVGRGIGSLARGVRTADLKSIGKGAVQIARAPAAPIRDAIKGGQVEREYRGVGPKGKVDQLFSKAALTMGDQGTYKKVTDILTRANAISKRDPLQRVSAVHSFWDAWKRGTLGKELKDEAGKIKQNPLRAPLSGAKMVARMVDTVAQPLFDKYIPNLKKGAAMEEMQGWMNRNPNASEADTLKQARIVSDSMDNRFGEMIQDNLFWNKTLKQTLQLLLLSPTWNIGYFREVGGGIVDAAARRGGLKQLTPRTEYALGITLSYALYNAMATYLKTGHGPQSLEDYYMYPTGGVNSDGSPERALAPGHTSETLQFLNDPMHEIWNKTNPALKLTSELLSGKDWRGYPIAMAGDGSAREPTAPEWFKSYAAHVGEAYEPLSIENVAKGKEIGSNLSTAETAAGVRKAPSFATNPARQAKIMAKRGMKSRKARLRADKRAENRREK